jgi:hypothetical protein
VFLPEIAPADMVQYAAIIGKQGASKMEQGIEALRVDFGRNKWNRSDWLDVKSARWDYVKQFVQEEDHIVNPCPDLSDEEIYATLAPPDLFGRGQESGKSRAALFREGGVSFVRSSNDRLAGWMAVKELLREEADGLPRLRIFRTCPELCRCLPMLLSDPLRPGDVLTEPHACDPRKLAPLFLGHHPAGRAAMRLHRRAHPLGPLRRDDGRLRRLYRRGRRRP